MRASGQKKGSRMTGTFLFSTEITGGWVRGYTIVLYFNPVTEHAVFSLAEQIAGRGISSKFLEYQMRPHITLACCSNVDETQYVQLLEGSETHKKPVCLGSVGMFPSSKTVFLSPVMTKELYAFQQELHETMQLFGTTGREWYCPDRRVPHCTVP